MTIRYQPNEWVTYILCRRVNENFSRKLNVDNKFEYMEIQIKASCSSTENCRREETGSILTTKLLLAGKVKLTNLRYKITSPRKDVNS